MQWTGTYLSNNYKLGLSFQYPLLLRERSKLQLNQLKRREAELAATSPSTTSGKITNLVAKTAAGFCTTGP